MHQLQGARTRRNAYSFGSLDYTSGRVTCPGIARSSYAALVLCLTLPGSIQRYAESLDNYIGRHLAGRRHSWESTKIRSKDA
jgi:hypothetical protein